MFILFLIPPLVYLLEESRRVNKMKKTCFHKCFARKGLLSCYISFGEEVGKEMREAMRELFSGSFSFSLTLVSFCTSLNVFHCEWNCHPLLSSIQKRKKTVMKLK